MTGAISGGLVSIDSIRPRRSAMSGQRRVEDDARVGGVVVGDDDHASARRRPGRARRRRCRMVRRGSSRRRRPVHPGREVGGDPARAERAQRRRPAGAGRAARRAPPSAPSDGADPERPPVGAVGGLGLDPRLGAELAQLLDHPLGRPSFAVGWPRDARSARAPRPIRAANPDSGDIRSATLPGTYHWFMLGGSSITLFHVRGIRISVDWSWFLVLFLVIFWLSRLLRQRARRGAARRPPRSCSPSSAPSGSSARSSSTSSATPSSRGATGSASPTSSSGSSAAWPGWIASPTALRPSSRSRSADRW